MQTTVYLTNRCCVFFTLALCLVKTTIVSGSENRRAEYEQHALNVVTARQATLPNLDNAIKVIRNSQEKPIATFWTNIINDRSYPAWHRRKCMYQFFLMYGQQTKLSAVLKYPGVIHWFKSANVTWETTSPAMPKPFDGPVRPQDDYYALSPELPRGNSSSIYVRLRGRFEPRHFDDYNTANPEGKFLRAITGKSDADDIYIEAVAIDDRP